MKTKVTDIIFSPDISLTTEVRGTCKVNGTPVEFWLTDIFNKKAGTNKVQVAVIELPDGLSEKDIDRVTDEIERTYTTLETVLFITDRQREAIINGQDERVQAYSCGECKEHFTMTVQPIKYCPNCGERFDKFEDVSM